MQKLTLVTGILALLWAFQSLAEVPSHKLVLHALQCRSFSHEWRMTVLRDEQFGIIQIAGEASVNGVPSSVSFSFPGQLTVQADGFTIKSDLINSDGSVDQFAIVAERAHLAVKYLTNSQLGTLVGSADEDLICQYL